LGCPTLTSKKAKLASLTELNTDECHLALNIFCFTNCCSQAPG
jgi:hypothetical protein